MGRSVTGKKADEIIVEKEVVETPQETPGQENQEETKKNSLEKAT